MKFSQFYLKAESKEYYSRVRFVGDGRCCHLVSVEDTAGYRKIYPETDEDRGLLHLVNLRFNPPTENYPNGDPAKRIQIQQRSWVHPKFIRFVDRRNAGVEVKFRKVTVPVDSDEYEIFEAKGFFEHTSRKPIVYIPVYATDENAVEQDVIQEDIRSFWAARCPVEIKNATYGGWARNKKLTDIEE